MQTRVFSILALAVIALAAVPAVSEAALQEPTIKIIPTSLSENASFIMIVDPMTTKKPVRIGWFVFDPNIDGRFLMGQLPVIGNKGVCYFSNDDPAATCGPSPLYGTGMKMIEVFVSTGDGERSNTTKIIRVGFLKIGGTPQLSDEDKRTVIINYYLDRSQVDSIKYTIYDESVQPVRGLEDRELVYRTSPIPHFYANATLNPGVYYIAVVAQKGNEYGGKISRIEVPLYNTLNIDQSKSYYYFGESITISGTTNFDSVEIEMIFPNGSIAERKVISVIDNRFSHVFEPSLMWPEGVYNFTIKAGELERIKQVGIRRLITANPKSIKKEIDEGSDVIEYINILNNGNDDAQVSLDTAGNLNSENVTIEKTVIEAKKTAIITINVTSVSTDISGSVIIKSNKTATEVPVYIKIRKAENQSSQEQCDCPDEQAECPEGAGPLSITPAVWNDKYAVGDTATISIRIKNEGDEKISGLSYIFEADQTSASDELPFYSFSPNIADLEIEPGKSEIVDFEFIPDVTGPYVGRFVISSSQGKASMFVSIDVFDNITEEIVREREMLSDVESEIDGEFYNEISSLLDSAESYVSFGNFEEARIKLANAKAIREFASGYTGASGSPDACDNVPSSGTVDAGSGGFDTIIIIIIAVVVLLGIAGVVIYMKSKGEKEYAEPQEDEYADEFGNY